LPTNFLPNQIAKALRDKQDQNLAFKPPQGKVVNLSGGGLFRDYEWMPETYDNFLKAKAQESKDRKLKQD